MDLPPTCVVMILFSFIPLGPDRPPADMRSSNFTFFLPLGPDRPPADMRSNDVIFFYTTKDPIDPLLTCVVIILLSFTTRTRSTPRRHAGLFTTFHIALCKLEWGARCLQKWHYKRIQSLLHRGEKWLQCYRKPPSRTAMAPNWWIEKIYFIQCHDVSLHSKRRRSGYN